MTQLQSAINNIVTEEMKIIAQKEGMETAELRARVAEGTVVIPANKNHKKVIPTGIGKGLTVKVNANIGTSPIKSDIKGEIKKLKVALKAGADALMDLSIGGDIDKTRQQILKHCPVPLGTVPLYQTLVEAGEPAKLNIDIFLEIFRRQANQGVDFVTIHAGLTKDTLPLIEKRVMQCVSRGGSLLIAWMRHHKKNSFLYEYYDEILDIAQKYDVTLSLGDGLRPGCIADATDEAQIAELKKLGQLAKRAREKGVQVMIEGPGHIPLNDIERNVELEKRYCENAPFYVLGPLPTDIATGYDHIAGAIGGALAGWKGADFLCYLTPMEHIGLPDLKDVREGVVVTKIAAHIADIARGNQQALNRNLSMAKAREKVDWQGMSKYVLDKERFQKLRNIECKKNPLLVDAGYCSMCGPFCVFKVLT